MAIHVGAVRRRYHVLRVLFPVQSWGQGASILAIALLVWGAGVLLTGVGRAGAEVMFVGAVIGILPAANSVLPGELCLRWSPERAEVKELVSQVLDTAGWRLTVSSAERDQYVQKLPGVLRWKEGDIVAVYQAGEAVIRGPIAGLGLLRHRLQKRLRRTGG